MIKELAIYEDSLDKVEATEDSLKHSLTFANGGRDHHNKGFAKTLILRLPVKPNHASDTPEAVAGMALYFHNYSTWRSRPGVYLEDLYVRPQYRKRGYGKMLIQELAREVVKIDGARLEWSCLKNNEPSLKFYRSLGAVEMGDWTQLRVDGKALEYLAHGRTAALQTGNRNRQTGQVLECVDGKSGLKNEVLR